MKAVLITGAGGGLGRATAALLAGSGYLVYAADVRPLEPSRNLIPLSLNVRDTASVEAAAAFIEKETGSLCAVIHFAGVYAMDSFIEIDEETLRRVMDVNMLGAYRVNKAFLPLLLKGDGRVILITSELAGQKPLPFNGIYAVSKTALEAYADALRLELCLLDVPVIVVRPGAFATEMLPGATRAAERLCASTKLYKDNTRAFQRVMQSQMGTAKPPEVLAKAIYRALTAKHPRPRYTVNAGFLLKVWNLLPRSLQIIAMRLLLR